VEEIKNDLLNTLPGTFILDISSPKIGYIPLGQANKQSFKEVLSSIIYQVAKTLKLEEQKNLTSQIIDQLSFSLPKSLTFALQKISNEGSALYKVSGVFGDWSLKLNEDELEEFERLVFHANIQLQLAKEEFNAEVTFLIIIEEGQRITHHSTIPEALKVLNYDSYSYISHVYCITGEEVTEIPLPITE
ncbi:hypothetical protein ACFLYQ_07590, partial [Chloroflexota bacterium]